MTAIVCMLNVYQIREDVESLSQPLAEENAYFLVAMQWVEQDLAILKRKKARKSFN